jgi:hypothetical protein
VGSGSSLLSQVSRSWLLGAPRSRQSLSGLPGLFIYSPGKDSSREIFKTRAWSEIFQALNENNFNPRIPYPAKLSFKIDRAIKIFMINRNSL